MITNKTGFGERHTGISTEELLDDVRGYEADVIRPDIDPDVRFFKCNSIRSILNELERRGLCVGLTSECEDVLATHMVEVRRMHAERGTLA
jgi:hypothetical protein